jgi:hypothetical protein
MADWESGMSELAEDIATPHAASTVAVARQPIFDRAETITGFEILYRSLTGPFTDAEGATSTVIVQSLADIGLERLVGDSRAFINVTPDAARARRARARREPYRRPGVAGGAARRGRRRLPGRARRLPLRARPRAAARRRERRQARHPRAVRFVAGVADRRAAGARDHGDRAQGRDARGVRGLPRDGLRRLPGLLLRRARGGVRPHGADASPRRAQPARRARPQGELRGDRARDLAGRGAHSRSRAYARR